MPDHITDTRQFQDDQTLSVDSDSSLSLEACLVWQGFDTCFTDRRIITGFSPRRDLLPEAFRALARSADHGDSPIRHRFAPGELIPQPDPNRRHRLPATELDPGHDATAPAIGRFYPAGRLSPSTLPEPEGALFRITDCRHQEVTIDFNHPLAGHALEISLRRLPLPTPPHANTGTVQDLVRLLCDNGPGMSDRLPHAETGFDHPAACTRLDEGDDSDFFTPSLEPFWDRRALDQVSRLYRQLIRPGQRVLDLMAGVHSPLQEAGIGRLTVTCAGLNSLELKHNPVCSERRILDVNRTLPLLWPDGHFDAVMIHAAIEYVVHPVSLLQDIQRILRPGGRIIISFSNHWVEEKAIRIWRELMDFERTGLVLSWLRKAGGFRHYQACSLRGMPRDPDSAARDALPCSDAVFAVWAEKTPA